MSLPFIGGGIASLAVIICIVLLSRKAAKKHFLELVEQSKTDFPRIEEFFSSLNTLSEHYISKSDEKNFKQCAEKISESFKNSGGIQEAVAFIESMCDA